MNTEEQPKCPHCGQEIDPETCWCGDPIKNHVAMWHGHEPVPMGCECGFVSELEIEDDSLLEELFGDNDGQTESNDRNSVGKLQGPGS